jgi:hypothetical protein
MADLPGTVKSFLVCPIEFRLLDYYFNYYYRSLYLTNWLHHIVADKL